MIAGVGIDLIEIARFEKECAARGDALVEEVLAPDELAYCRSMHVPFPFYAARFAAKEAFFKAIGTGLRGKLSWHDLEVCRDDLGKPRLELRGEAASLAERRLNSPVNSRISTVERYT